MRIRHREQDIEAALDAACDKVKRRVRAVKQRRRRRRPANTSSQAGPHPPLPAHVLQLAASQALSTGVLKDCQRCVVVGVDGQQRDTPPALQPRPTPP